MRRGVPITPGLAAAIAFAFAAFAANGASAQQETVIIGGSGLPEIEINLGVLDMLGDAPPPTSPLFSPVDAGMAVRPADLGPGPVGAVEQSAIEPSPPVAAKKAALPTPSQPKPAAPVEPVEPVAPVMTATIAPIEPPPPPSPKPALDIAPSTVTPEAEPAKTTAPVVASPTKSAEDTKPAVETAAAAAAKTAPESAVEPKAEPKAEPEPTEAVAALPTAATTPEPAAAPAAETVATPSEPVVAELPEAPSPLPVPSAGSNGAAVIAVLSQDESSASAGEDDPLLIEFERDSARLPEKSWSQLKGFARQLLKTKSLRVQVKAYAGSSTISVSAARRLSLSRALAVRAFLIERGVRSTRIDVRALGNRSEGGPPERVDVVLVDR